MKCRIVTKSLIGVLFPTLLLWMNTTTAQSQSISVEQKIDSTKIVPGEPIKYQHFGNGKRMRRIPGKAGSTCLRGRGKNHLTVLVPENNPILTTVEQPKLFFYLPKTAKTSVLGFEFFVEDAAQKVIYQKKYKVNQKPGIFSLNLPANKNQRLLEVSQEYNWYLTVICNRADRSLDLVVGGIIKQIVPDKELTNKLKKALPRERAALYAANGIWYDSLAILAQLRRQRPNDAALQRDWQSLLESVKLANIVPEPLLGELEIE
ncbi:DUF928 domain-containing protein [Nostoc sp. PCC 7107]|uniref:DUF928 domain-containing protein n=1 Tax=Nostoc sp. PCC 7107 TaxID=317936 RepID=UPI00029F1A34|nr:DUF928 domain-containing protein [Nostoc sp. PCC 7107]AFY41712.1 protein of unknown function DUF928 [Nostoc sp. PCC 7107]